MSIYINSNLHIDQKRKNEPNQKLARQPMNFLRE